MNWIRLFPKVTEEYKGSQIAFYYFVLIAVISTVRSLIHIVLSDGGANSIAGIAINVAGGTNIISIFAQWGASQLVLAFIYWLIIVRYQFLVPCMLAIITLEQFLRIGVGHLKPLEVSAMPPGAIGSYLILPLSLIALVLSLWQKSKAA
ncbi:MAG TPA: hypothetical protein VMF88_03125 [Bacteroidota bacterium]|nr:hypothetical protein [Bacteroidota bacterium]